MNLPCDNKRDKHTTYEVEGSRQWYKANPEL